MKSAEPGTPAVRAALALGLLLFISFSPVAADVLRREDGQSAEAFVAAVKGWPQLPKPIAGNLSGIIHAYPGEIVGVETAGEGKPVHVQLRNGKKAVFEDLAEKDFEGRLEHADINEMLFDVYPKDMPADAWPKNLDPGRYRCHDFFKGIYGATEKEVAGNLVRVPFCGKTLQFNKHNGAAAALEAVGRELEALAKKDPALDPYLKSLGGTFAWRQVAGTEQLSAHSFAIAIDLNPDLGGYWRWEKRGLEEMGRRRKYPASIVSAFERHGFIWGGKWYHFDLMHFEFRPEFTGKNPYASKTAANVEPAAPILVTATASTAATETSPATSEVPAIKPTASATPTPTPPPAASSTGAPLSSFEQEMQKVADAATASTAQRHRLLGFGLDLYRAQLKARPNHARENLVLAPAVAYRSMAALSGITNTPQTNELQPADLAPPAELTSQKAAPRIASAVWSMNSGSFPEGTAARLSTDFETSCFPMGKVTSEQAATSINLWMSGEPAMGGLVVAPKELPAETALVAASGSAARSAWAVPMDPAASAPGEFHALDGSKTAVTMMKGRTMAGLNNHASGVQAISLPLEIPGTDLLILLPAPGEKTLQELEASLKPELVDEFIDGLKAATIKLSLPRGIVRSRTFLEPAASAPHPARIIHAAAFTLDEGARTTASAAIPATAADSSEVVLNRPFLFLLLEMKSRHPLFVGRLSVPAASAGPASK